MKTPILTTISVLFMLLPLHPLYAAQIQASVDRNPVSLNESFQITFQTTETPDDEPDFSALQQDFDILSQSQNSKSSWINGKSSKTLLWIVNVMAKQTGNLIIPAIIFGDDSSQPIPVQVIEATGNKAGQTDTDVFLEVEANPQSPYVQAQVLYTLRLYRRVEIAQASLTEPELPDAVIEKLGDDNNFNTQINGVDYWVTERKYAIFPQKSGQMEIKPLQLTAQVVTSTRPSFSGFFNPQMTQTQRVTSQPVTLDVKPVPASFNGRHWLAAEQLYLKEEWSGDPQKMKVGEPLTRTLTVLANGSTVSQLPELNTAKPAVSGAEGADAQLKSYPDQPVLQEQKKADGVIAFREEKIALIPSKAGSYTLPAIEVPWFNTKTQKMEIAKIPETSLTALEVEGAQQAPQIPAAPPAAQAAKIHTKPLVQTQQSNIWLWVSVFLALGWLATLIYLFSKRRGAKQTVIDDSANRIRLEDSLKNLKKACHANDPFAAKEALLAWARQKGTGEANLISLGAIAAQSDARLRDEILLLNQVLYGKDADQWQGKKLFQAFVENKARKTVAAVDDDGLEPLYRL